MLIIGFSSGMFRQNVKQVSHVIGCVRRFNPRVDVIRLSGKSRKKSIYNQSICYTLSTRGIILVGIQRLT